MTEMIRKKLETLPDNPGVYIFLNQKKEIIYVGKASSLKNRVRSYWNGQRTLRPIEQMIHEVVEVSWKKTESVLEAIILEGRYIKEHQPKYNVLWKDDKSWNYIVITKDVYPQVVTVREHDLNKLERESTYLFGPYPGLNTRAAIKILRRLFLISICKPHATRPCIYNQMGECLGVCSDQISPAEYKKQVIRPLVTFLKGGKKSVLTLLKKRMMTAAKEHHFEEAARLRDQLEKLQHIQDIALLNTDFVREHLSVGVSQSGVWQVHRVEGYDISNLGATGTVGSMVVFDETGPIKSQYRKFKIRTVQGQSDVDALEEVLRRRLKHPEWPMPDVFLIDGGKPQVGRATKVLKEAGIETPVVGIAKGPLRKKNEFVLGSRDRGFLMWLAQHQRLLVQVRDEAHRFAVSYQKKLRRIKK